MSSVCQQKGNTLIYNALFSKCSVFTYCTGKGSTGLLKISV